MLSFFFTFIFRWIPAKERLLKPAEVVDIVKGVLLIACCYFMTWFDTSVLYHLIKAQSTIKIYLIFNMLEIADRYAFVYIYSLSLSRMFI